MEQAVFFLSGDTVSLWRTDHREKLRRVEMAEQFLLKWDLPNSVSAAMTGWRVLKSVRRNFPCLWKKKDRGRAV